MRATKVIADLAFVALAVVLGSSFGRPLDARRVGEGPTIDLDHGLALPGPPSGASGPDVLFVVLDTVRADHVGAHGYARDTTPAYDAFARDAVRFTSAWSCGDYTPTAHACLFTGALPWENGVYTREHPIGGALGLQERLLVWSGRVDLDRFRFTVLHPLAADAPPTLATRFSEAGWVSAYSSSNYYLRWSTADSLLRGFDMAWGESTDHTWFTKRTTHDATQDWAEHALAVARASDRPLFLFVNIGFAHDPYVCAPALSAHYEALAGPAEREAVARMCTGGGPLAEFHHPQDDTRAPALEVVHHPGIGDKAPLYVYGSRAPVVDEAAREVLTLAYDANLREADARLGALLAWWDAAHDDDTVVVVTSDHGEFLGEHDRLAHAHDVRAPLTHVPLAIRAPGWRPRDVSRPVGTHRVAATMAGLAGLDVGPDSLAALARTGDEPRRAVVSQSFPKDGKRLVDVVGPDGYNYFDVDKWRYHDPAFGSLALVGEACTVDDGCRRWFLYDHAADPDELTDLGPTLTEVVARYVPAAEAHFRALADGRRAAPMSDAEAEEAMLQSLGYFGG